MRNSPAAASACCGSHSVGAIRGANKGPAAVALVGSLERFVDNSVTCLIKSVDNEAYHLSAPSNKPLPNFSFDVCGTHTLPLDRQTITTRNWNLGCPHLDFARVREFL